MSRVITVRTTVQPDNGKVILLTDYNSDYYFPMILRCDGRLDMNKRYRIFLSSEDKLNPQFPN